MEVEGIDLADTDLSALKRPILQRICKALGIKAVGKNKDLVHKLEDHVRVHAPSSPAKRRSASSEVHEDEAVAELEVAQLSLNDKQTKHEGSSTPRTAKPLQPIHAKNVVEIESEQGRDTVISNPSASPFYYPFEAVVAAKSESRLGTPLGSNGNMKDVICEKENCSTPSKSKKGNCVVSSPVSVTLGSNKSKKVNFSTKSTNPKAPCGSPRIAINGTPVRGTPQRRRVLSGEAKQIEDDNDDAVEFHDASDSWNHLDQELANRLSISAKKDAQTPSPHSSPSPATEVFVDAMTPGTLLRSTPFRGLMTPGLSPKPIFKLPSSHMNKEEADDNLKAKHSITSTPNLKNFEFPFGPHLTHFRANTSKPTGTAAESSVSRAPHTTGKVRCRKVTFTTTPPPGRRIAQPRSKSKSPVSISMPGSLPVVDRSSHASDISNQGNSSEIFGKATETVLREMENRVSDTMKMPENERAKLYPHIFKSNEKNRSPESLRKKIFDNIHRKTFRGLDSISNHYAAKRTARLKHAHTLVSGSSHRTLERTKPDSDESAIEFSEKGKRRSGDRFMSVGVKKIKLDRKEVASSKDSSEKSHTTTKLADDVNRLRSPQPKEPVTPSKEIPGTCKSTGKRLEQSFSPIKFKPSSSASPLLQRAIVRLAALNSNDRANELLKAMTDQQDKETEKLKRDDAEKSEKNVNDGGIVQSADGNLISPSIPVLEKSLVAANMPKPNQNQRKSAPLNVCASKGSRNVLKGQRRMTTQEISLRKTERNVVDMTPAQKDIAKSTFVTDTIRKISKESPPKTVIRMRPGSVLPVSASARPNRTRAKSFSALSAEKKKSADIPSDGHKEKEMEMVVEQLEMISVASKTLPSTPVIRPNEDMKGQLNTTVTKRKVSGKRDGPLPGDSVATASKTRSMGKCVTFVPSLSNSPSLGAPKPGGPEVFLGMRKSPSEEIKKPQESSAAPATPKSVKENTMSVTPSAKKTTEPGFLRSTKSSLLKSQKPMNSPAPIFNPLQSVNRSSVLVPFASAKKPVTVPPSQTVRPVVTTRVTRSQIPARAKKDATGQVAKPSRIIQKSIEPCESDDTRKTDSKKVTASSPVASQRIKFDIAASLARPLSYRPHTGRLTIVPSPKSLATGEAKATIKQNSVTPDAEGDIQGKKRAPVRPKVVPKVKVSEVEPLAPQVKNTARSGTKVSAAKPNTNMEESEKKSKSAANTSVPLPPVETEVKMGRGLAMSTRSKTCRVGSEKENKKTCVPLAKENVKIRGVKRSVGAAKAK